MSGAKAVREAIREAIREDRLWWRVELANR